VPAAFGGTGFQPGRRTGKMPVPPRIFQDRVAQILKNLDSSVTSRLNRIIFYGFMGGQGQPAMPEKGLNFWEKIVDNG